MGLCSWHHIFIGYMGLMHGTIYSSVIWGLWAAPLADVWCHTPVLKSRTEASIRVPKMFNHTHSNNMINR
jgi:hypothetical protein